MPIRYGLHLSTSGKLGVEGAALEAELLGLSALQIFAKSPRAWKTRSLKGGEVEGFRARRENLGGLPTVIHASYLVNLASPDEELWAKSVFSLADDLAKAQQLGVEYVCVHPGSGPADRCLEGALKALALADVGRGGPRLLLENTVGGGEKLGGSLEALASLIRGTPLGVCLDTCHAFAAGYPHDELVDIVEAAVGLGNVPVFHLNDSAEEFGSGKDRHASLLEGFIGEGLRGLVLDRRLEDKLFIMEAQRGTREDAHNLRTIREWLEGRE